MNQTRPSSLTCKCAYDLLRFKLLIAGKSLEKASLNISNAHWLKCCAELTALDKNSVHHSHLLSLDNKSRLKYKP
jgi:hypothetical protein